MTGVYLFLFVGLLFLGFIGVTGLFIFSSYTTDIKDTLQLIRKNESDINRVVEVLWSMEKPNKPGYLLVIKEADGDIHFYESDVAPPGIKYAKVAKDKDGNYVLKAFPP